MKRTEKMYSLALRKRENSKDFFWLNDNFQFHRCNIDTGDRYWLADPFLYEKNNTIYLFYEAFDLIERKGKIGYSVMSDDGSKDWSKPHIIIDEPYHLSFPNIFEKNGDIFIMPESCGDYRVKLFRARSFPNHWESIDTDILLPDIYACDSIIISHKGNDYLLVNEMYHNTPNGLFPSCWVKNRLFKMDNMNITNDGVKVSEGDFGQRNAGKSFEIGNKLYRIGQDCRQSLYGRGLVLFEVGSLEPYVENIIWSKDCNELAKFIDCNQKNIIGVHTYNYSNNYEVIDYSQMQLLPTSVIIRRNLRRIKRLIKKITSHL
ncbi:MAG: hypothetical protein J6C10_07240 [Prevotella sp.]|nr:hypothetical protein [Prevotella sp.]